MSPVPGTSRRWRKRWILIGLLLALVPLGLGAWQVQKFRQRPLRIVISGDTAGWITPCGCTSNQSGGLLRRGNFIDFERQHWEVIVADVGGAPGGTSAYHQVKFEAILRGELAMGIQAHNLGGPEIALGADYLRKVGQDLGVPFVSANVQDANGQTLAEPYRIVEQAGQRIAFIGVLAQNYARNGIRISDPQEAVRRIAADVRPRCDAVIVLAYLPEDQLQQLAASCPEVDAVVGGPTGQSISPRQVGPTLLAAATNKGKFLIELDVPGPRQQGRWGGTVYELNNAWSDDPVQQANVRQYLDELAKRDFPAATTGFAPALPAGLPAGYRFAGSQACAECHKDDCKSFGASKHAHAWQTLTERGYHVDAYCQKCHTTGYGQPGGFESVALSAGVRGGVGCENCHGPSQAHVKNPRQRTPFAAKDQCITCHDRENSPTFAYDAFWQKITHGAPLPKPGTPGQ